MNCEICAKEFWFQWTDSHGIGVCGRCGMPYRILHYDDDKKRIDKPPIIAVGAEWIPVAKRYWQETKTRVLPAVFDMGFLGGRSRTYSGATMEDIRAWDEWLAAHKNELPQELFASAGSGDPRRLS